MARLAAIAQPSDRATSIASKIDPAVQREKQRICIPAPLFLARLCKIAFASRIYVMKHLPERALPEWEQVLSAAARLQTLLPQAVLVGGTASAIHASHRFSRDADHVLTDLKPRFDAILEQLESVAGWKTARVQRPVLILGSLDGIETGIRQLVREQPLEITEIEASGQRIRIPSLAEILRIKGILILKRNSRLFRFRRSSFTYGCHADQCRAVALRFYLSATQWTVCAATIAHPARTTTAL